MPLANVVAVCSNNPQEVEWAKRNSQYRDFEIGVYDSFDKMLDHPNIEAVWISTSTDVHAQQSLAAIKKGLHVLCEKPLSTDIEEVCLGP